MLVIRPCRAPGALPPSVEATPVRSLAAGGGRRGLPVAPAWKPPWAADLARGRLLSPVGRHATAAPPPEPTPTPTRAPEVEVGHGHLRLHIPLLAGAAARVERLEASLMGECASSDGAARAVVEVPIHPKARHFFGDPLASLEVHCGRVARRAALEAGEALAHLACRLAGLGLFAAVGLWAGVAQLRSRPSVFNLGGRAHPLVGYTLLALSLPVPVLPLAGAAVGARLARVVCRGLAPTSAATGAAAQAGPGVAPSRA